MSGELEIKLRLDPSYTERFVALKAFADSPDTPGYIPRISKPRARSGSASCCWTRGNSSTPAAGRWIRVAQNCEARALGPWGLRRQEPAQAIGRDDRQERRAAPRRRQRDGSTPAAHRSQEDKIHEGILSSICVNQAQPSYKRCASDNTKVARSTTAWLPNRSAPACCLRSTTRASPS